MKIIKKIIKWCTPYGLLKIYQKNKNSVSPVPKVFQQNNDHKFLGNFINDYILFKKQQEESEHPDDFVLGNLYPCFEDKYLNNGICKGDYFHQDLLVARRIFENKPENHIDVGSSVASFVAHVASFREITVLDIRPSIGKSHNISFVQQDFMSDLDASLISSTDSLSCLHAMEHFGLGRYGDSIDYNGHLIGIDNLYKMLKKKGKLYFSVPIGHPQRIEFHAHRIFSPKYLYDIFSARFKFDFFSYVNGITGDLHENVDLISFINTFNDSYGCGIFEMTKL